MPLKTELEKAKPVDQQYAKLQRSYGDLKLAFKDACGQITDLEQQIETLLAVRGEIAIRAYERLKKKKINGTTVGINCSDWHYEERVDPKTVGGLNSFDVREADKRIARLWQKSVEMIDFCRHLAPIHAIVLGLLGDHITGYIHEELMENAQLSPTEASLRCQELILGGIEFLHKETKLPIDVVTAYGNHGRCHDDKTELLTEDGWKTYDKLRVGESVATYNMQSEAAEWQSLDEVYVDNYCGDMIHVKHASADFMVTPRHRMVVRDYHSDVAEFREMQSLSEDSIGCKFFPKYAIGKQCDLPDVTDDELTLLGWIMTDVSITRQVSRSKIRPSLVSIYQSKPERVREITDLLLRMRCCFTTSCRRRDPPVINGVQCKAAMPEYTFHIKNQLRDRVLQLLPNKTKIPKWFRDLSQRQVAVWLRSVTAGDGSTKPTKAVDADGTGKHYEIHGTKEFLEQVQALLIVNGVSSRVRLSMRGDSVLIVRGTRRGYINNWNKSVQRVHYDGVIWCGTVKNGTLITRRNGIPLISGNTTQKRRVATGYKNSYEWMMYHVLRYRCIDRKLPVRWHISNGYHNVMDIEGHKVRYHHGDAIRYQGGVGGITIPVNKAIAQWNKANPVALDVFGHWHTFMANYPNWISNGCLIGYAPYSVEIKADYQRPTQSLFVMDREKGLTVPALPIFVT